MTIADRDDGGRYRVFSWVASHRRTLSAPKYSAPDSGQNPWRKKRRRKRRDWASWPCYFSNGDDDDGDGDDDGDHDGGHDDARDDDDGDDRAGRVGRRWRSHCS